MIDELLADVRAGGDDAEEAAVTLALLIERGSRPEGADDSDIDAALLPQYAGKHLTAAEREQAIQGLLEIVGAEPFPPATAVWALSKSFEARVAPALIGVLERSVEDPEREHLAYQALTGLIPFDTPEVRQVFKWAAERGHGRVQETARQYLDG